MKSSTDPWIPRLAEFLRANQQTEAVAWDHQHTELNVATIGVIEESALRRELEKVLSSAPTPSPAADLPAGLQVRTEEGKTRIEKEHGCAEHTQLWTWRRIPWPTAAEVAGLEEEPEDWRVLAVLAGTCGVLGIAGFIVQQAGIGESWLAPVLYILSMLAGGWDAAREVGPKIFKGKIDIHFLMLAVAVGASIIGAFGEGALLLFLFSAAGAMEQFALFRTRKEIHSLFRAAPKTATVKDPSTGRETVVPVETIKPGDIVLVRPGDSLPVDGIVLSGDSATDESSLTGEAHPVGKSKGDPVFSGTANLWGAMEIKCQRPASESSIQKIIRLIQDARQMRAPSQRFTDRFGPRYTVGVLIVTTLMFFVWWLGLGLAPFFNTEVHGEVQYSAFYRAMTLLVVASPCALVLSIPSAVLAAIAWGARHGILFRGGAAIEQLATIDTVALDKTGTLTTGDLEVISIESFPPGREETIGQVACAMERRASHPIARAIVRHGERNQWPELSVENFRSLTGQGVEALVDGMSCLLGARSLLESGDLATWAKELPGPAEGFTEVWCVTPDTLGRILLRDTLRTASAPVIDDLTAAKIQTVMLTGDRPEAAQAIAGHLPLTRIEAGLSPQGKVDAIRKMKSEGHTVAMVGDGVNDAPCLALADIAVAMGARGSDAAMEQSDVVLMNDRIENFLEAYRLSRRARRIIRQNVILALGTIGVMVSAAFLGLVPISIGVMAHEGSTILVCLNSLRLLGSPRR